MQRAGRLWYIQAAQGTVKGQVAVWVLMPACMDQHQPRQAADTEEPGQGVARAAVHALVGERLLRPCVTPLAGCVLHGPCLGPLALLLTKLQAAATKVGQAMPL